MSMYGKRFLLAASAMVGVGAAGLMMAAPASAAVTEVSITTPSGFGSVADTYGTGCEYEVAATVNDYSESAADVEFEVTNNGGTTWTDLGSAATPTEATVTESWAPSDRGVYQIRARQGATAWQYTANLTVGTGFQVPNYGGSVELPFAGTCFILQP